MSQDQGNRRKPPAQGGQDWSDVDRYLANIPAPVELPPLPAPYAEAATEVLAPSYPRPSMPPGYAQPIPTPYGNLAPLPYVEAPTVPIEVPRGTPAPYSPLPPPAMPPPPIHWDAPTVSMGAGRPASAPSLLDPIAPPPMRATPALSDSPSDDALFEALFPEDEQDPQPVVDDLVLAQEELPAVTDAALWGETGELRPMVESRRGERFECDPPVAGKLTRLEGGKVSNGEVRSISSGGLFLQVENPLPLETALVVTLVRGDGQKLSVGARVVFRPKDNSGMAIRLSAEVRARAFVLSYIDFLRQKRSGIQRSEILVKEVDEAKVDPEDHIESNTEEAALNRAWAAAKADLDNKLLHQEFLNQCVSLKKIDYALECYRKLQTEYPDDARIKKYLQNVGTVLGFYALKPSAKQEESNAFLKLPSPGKLVLYIAILLALVSLTMLVKARAKREDEEAAAKAEAAAKLEAEANAGSGTEIINAE
ncbi:MAG: PilZ domain-containing protein [Deltaproteobacteria bacterium]|nr:PilZ domain-containing protein [Deltaproteobacteria bacterium]